MTTAAARGDEIKIRVGIIGCDTSHVPAFTSTLNEPNEALLADPIVKEALSGIRVVAAFPGGSKDIPSSANRVEGFTQGLRDKGVEIVDSIETLLTKVDAVLIESVDGRPHLAQARPVLAARKPVFIDKPVAGSLADAVEIFRLAKEHNTPCFSSSSLRFSPGIIGMRNDERVGKVMGVASHGPCELEPHHPDLFWYGVHGVEVLFTIMGTGCETVARFHSEGNDHVTGQWKDGRVGTFRGIRNGAAPYGATVFGDKGVAPTGQYAGYAPLVVEIARFFKSGQPPVSADETIEMFAFMEAADESKRQGGAPVKIADVLAKARETRAAAPVNVDDMLQQALAAAQGGKLEEAERLASTAVKAAPENLKAVFLRGRIREAMRRYDDAIADYSTVIATDPVDADALFRRGVQYFFAGKMAEAIADWDEQIKLNPDIEPQHWQRGIAHYYAGRFEDGKKQFDIHQTVNSADVENAVWRLLCQAKVDGVEKAVADILKIGEDGRVPMKEVYRLFAGQAQPEDVLTAAIAGKPGPDQLNQRQFYAHLYLGLWHEAHGREDKALEHITTALEKHRVGHYMWDVARVHVALRKK